MTAARTSNGRRIGGSPSGPPAAGFALVELLVVVALLALLLSLLLPALQKARGRAREAVCGSNIRQVALANMSYALDAGRYCPGAARMKTENRHRWHGIRGSADEPFDSAYGPLATYLGAPDGIRQCPAFRTADAPTRSAFERGCGGYGYNRDYLGRLLERRKTGSFKVVTDEYGALSDSIRRPAETLMFADTAFAATDDGVIEYSFAEPRFHPEYMYARKDPSIHFRHADRAVVAWCDGHVDGRRRTFSWRSGLYTGDPQAERLGWFGPDDDNGLFDLE